MSGAADEWDRRRRDAERWQKLDERLARFDERLGAIEERLEDDVLRRKHIREFFEDLGRWAGYLGKLIVSLGVIGGAAAALVAWMARNGG